MEIPGGGFLPTGKIRNNLPVVNWDAIKGCGDEYKLAVFAPEKIWSSTIPQHHLGLDLITRWWFQIRSIFIPTWGNDPI